MIKGEGMSSLTCAPRLCLSAAAVYPYQQMPLNELPVITPARAVRMVMINWMMRPHLLGDMIPLISIFLSYPNHAPIQKRGEELNPHPNAISRQGFQSSRRSGRLVVLPK